jgi:hypothetical protein
MSLNQLVTGRLIPLAEIRLLERLSNRLERLSHEDRASHPRCECHACTQARWIMSGQNSQELPGPSGWDEDGDHLTAEFYKWKGELFKPVGMRTVR